MPARSTELAALAASLLRLLAGAARAGGIQQPGTIQQPKRSWQVPGEIRAPTGNWQVPGEIRAPRGIQAISSDRSGCQRRFDVLGDALFAFDKAALDPRADETLAVLGPQLDPVAPNRKPDGSDDPAGRQKNRRVEVLVDGCG